MADIVDQLNESFGSIGKTLNSDLVAELTSILRVYSLSPEELKWKWDAYCIRLGNNDAQLDLQKAQELRSDLQDGLERDSREKVQAKLREQKRVTATPKVGRGGDVFGMLDGLVPTTPHTNGSSKIKRKADYDTPSLKATKSHASDTPNIASSPINGINGSQPSKSGTVQETLNSHIEIPDAPSHPPAEARIKLKANTEMGKFAYKSMAVKLSEASEILDDRIDEFAGLVKEHHKLDDETFGNPCFQSPNEVVAVGRIACDSSEGRLNAASTLLETSRRTGAGMRVPLKLAADLSYDFFPGKIVALRGVNPSGEFFTVSEVLSIPSLPPAASSAADLEIVQARMRGSASAPKDEDDMDTKDTNPSTTRPLTILVASGPYTTDTDLDFSGFHTLLTTATETKADSLILFGPFLDAEHPLLLTGDFDLPAELASNPDKATLTDLFKHHISGSLHRLAAKLPSIQIIMIPSVRDAIAKHVSWPQDRIPKKDLGLPKQVAVVTNPVTLSVNELVVGLSSLDALEQLRATTLTADRAKVQENLLARLVRQMIEQRHFFPIYPALDRKALASVRPTPGAGETEHDDSSLQPMSIGAPVDIAYSKLGDWLYVKPDLLMVPSSLPPFAKVVESVLAVNPGTVMKKRGTGTFARLTIQAQQVSDEERTSGQLLGHKLWERSRVDIVRT